MDYKFDGLEKDTVTYPHDKEATHIKKIDEAVTDEALRVIRQEGPDLSWVYLEFTDDMGHRYGDSPQFYDAVFAADRQIGKIWAAIKEREKTTNEDWCIIITTDHGSMEVSDMPLTPDSMAILEKEALQIAAAMLKEKSVKKLANVKGNK